MQALFAIGAQRQQGTEKKRMLRQLIRLLGFGALALAMVTGVLDGARSLADSSAAMVDLASASAWLLPGHFPLMGPAITRNIHPLLWDPLLVNVLRLPAVLVLFGLGTLFLVLGRPRSAPIRAPERP